MVRANFWPVQGPEQVVTLRAASGATIAKGDPVVFSSGFVAIGTATSTSFIGVAYSAVTSATEGDAIKVNICPETVYEVYCVGTLNDNEIGVGRDISGSTGAFYINESAGTYDVVKIVAAPDGVGANVRVHVKFIRLDYAAFPNQTLNSSDYAAGSVDATALASTVAGNGLTGGGGSALAVGAGNGITVAADAISVTSDVTTGATVCSLAVGANGCGTTLSATGGLQHTAGSLAIKPDTTTGATVCYPTLAANGVGITLSATGGLQHTAGSLAIKPDTTTGATVCYPTLAANGAGITIDNSTLEHTAGSLHVKAAGIGIAQLATAVAGAGLTGGGGAALDVGAGNGITVAADSVAVKPDVTTGATVCALTVGANGAGVTVDQTTIEHNSNTLRIAATAAGNGLTGGGASALAVGAGNGITVAADAISVTSDVTTGATVCSLTVGANGCGTTLSGTGGLQHTAGSLAIKPDTTTGATICYPTLGANGVGITLNATGGLAHTAGSLAIKPDTTTGATVCYPTLAANGAGITIDNSTLEHTAGSLHVKDAGVTAAKLNADALVATKIPDYDDGVSYGIPFVCSQVYADAGTVNIFNANAPFKFRIILWWNHALDATASNVKLSNGANDITANIAHGGTDHAIVMGGDLVNAYYEIALGGSLQVITDGAGSDGRVYCLCVPVA